MKKLLLCLLAIGLLCFNVQAAMESSPSSVDTITPPSGTLTIGGTGERITGFTYGEYIDFNDEGDDVIKFGGASGSDDTDIAFDLDGTEPRIYSPTDAKIMIDEGLDLNDKAMTNVGDIALDSLTSDAGTTITINDDLHIGADDAAELIEIHDAGTLKFWDSSDDSSVVIGPVTNGTTILEITGSLDISGDVDVEGILESRIKITLDTDPTITLGVADCKNAIRVNNDNDVIDYTLPNAETGLSVVIQSMFAQVVTIDCFDTNESIVLDDTTLTAGNAIDSPGTKGDYILLVAISDSLWVVMGRSGAWVDGNAD